MALSPNYILPRKGIVEIPELVLHIGVELPAEAVEAGAHLAPALLIVHTPPLLCATILLVWSLRW